MASEYGPWRGRLLDRWSLALASAAVVWFVYGVATDQHVLSGWRFAWFFVTVAVLLLPALLRHWSIRTRAAVMATGLVAAVVGTLSLGVITPGMVLLFLSALFTGAIFLSPRDTLILWAAASTALAGAVALIGIGVIPVTPRISDFDLSHLSVGLRLTVATAGFSGALTAAVSLALGRLTRSLEETRSVESALRALERQQAAILSASRDPLVAVDTEGTVVFASQAVEDVFGWPPRELTGRDVATVLPDGERSRAIERIREVAGGSDDEAPSVRGLVLVRKNGTRFPAEVKLSTLHLPDRVEPVALGVVRDVTREREIEDQFRQAQKMEAIARLSAGIAHDFNNLLTPILGFSQIHLHQDGLSDKLRSGLETIMAAGERGSMLVNQLLNFVRPTKAPDTVVDIDDMLREIRPLLNGAVPEDVALRVKESGDAALVRGDRGKLEQVVMNLVVNACDAMVGGGDVRIHVGVDQHHEGIPDAAHALPPGAYVTLEVSDTGVGMTEETMRWIFEPFFTTKDRGQGTGLGLSTVFGIVQGMSGGVFVESALGQGTTFRVVLPRATPAPAVAATPGQSEWHGKGEIALVVDDDDGVRTTLCSMLESLGLRVRSAAGGGEVLPLLTQLDHLDLLLTDCVMPGMNGEKVAEAVRGAFPSVRVITMTGYSSKVMEGSLTLLRPHAVLRKPIRYGDLVDALAEALP